MSLESEVKDFIQEVVVRAEKGEASQREIAQARELRVRLNEYYEFLQDMVYEGTICFDRTVAVSMDGNQIRFPNEDSFAEWLHGYLE